MAVAKDSLFEQQVSQLRSSMIDSLLADRKDVAERRFARYTIVAHRLYQTLLAPVVDKISGKNLIIVPDGVLNTIPFEALLTEAVNAEEYRDNYSELPYLLKEHAVSYAYSATLLLETLNRKKTQAQRDYLAFAPVFANGLADSSKGAEFLAQNLADDSTFANTRAGRYALKASAKEVTGILDLFDSNYGFFERLFRDKSHAYLENEATEAQVKSPNLAEYRFVYFVTHGAAKADSRLSGILLAQNDSANEDGILHLGEVYNLNLNADLVVLSACETGRGEIKRGEGIIGLTRGFLYAGASNLLVSLWQVDDEATAKLMLNFYDRMLGGMCKAEALQEAKLQMIRDDPVRAMPYYWSAFILIGR